ncbi:STAS domain-containing protein [Frankia sp. CNm7]|uniref:Anti-sigma factor antagonist n=1 Tax=Frankia nepalensis TaxID=1836974 RepID=A0A937RDR4_9ACTN|nr:STAS domain-containing protein [Frankia nepalensis]MBL7497701.1 STAS domain-containing protein [Frankia nepalensis]MBL7514287.1 STAS domain-containing protein [Frankia nepalensis]MBL7519376.1 STAS domain-containing protein [Frankia nepalensis]MBL7630243.1 STAS domain-containing protein [Frankia nepalensis]
MILRVRVEVTGPHAIVIRPEGDIDYSSLDPLREALMDARVAGVREIVIDFADVGFLDSQGLAVILYAHRRLRTTGGRLILRNLNDMARRLLHVTNLTMVLDVEGGVGEPPTAAAVSARRSAAPGA